MLAGAALLAVLTLIASANGTPTERPLAIYAAASLTEAFRAHSPGQNYSFGSSTTLERQIEQGAPADVFASASPRNTQRLFAAGLVEKPVTFTANRLALIVPTANPAGVRTVYDLRRGDVQLVVAGSAVPVGAYTRTVLQRLGLTSALRRVVSQEPDVKSVVGKVAFGQADAGFVYMTDARAAHGRVRLIPIPARAQPLVQYQIAVVERSDDKAAARAWVKDILSLKGQAALRNAGFLPIPKVTT